MISVLRELLINNRHVKRRDNVVAVKPIYVPESLIEQNYTVVHWNSYITLVCCCFEFFVFVAIMHWMDLAVCVMNDKLFFLLLYTYLYRVSENNVYIR